MKSSFEKPSILLVDDRPENLTALSAVLDGLDIRIRVANSGNEALGLLLENDCAVVLLDVQMPQMDGFETAELMRQNRRTSHIPIIFVTARDRQEQLIFKGYESGAVDYLVKPLEPVIVRNKVRVFVDLYPATAASLRIPGFSASQSESRVGTLQGSAGGLARVGAESKGCRGPGKSRQE